MPRPQGGRECAQALFTSAGAAPSQPTANTITVVKWILLFSMLTSLRNINLPELENPAIMGVMNDLSQIGRPGGANEERRIAARGSALLSGERRAENISGPGGRRKPLKRLNSDKENPRKTSRFLGLSLRGLGPIWLNLVRFGSGLAQFQHAQYGKRLMPLRTGASVSSNEAGSRPTPNTGRRPPIIARRVAAPLNPVETTIVQ
jgi:hypothetical protein